MAIEGPLRELGIQDVLQLLDMSRKSGVLRVTQDDGAVSACAHFDEGRIVHVVVQGQPSTLAELLLASGRVSALDLDHARRLAEQSTSPRTMLDVLIETGALSLREVERLIQAQMERAVFELLSWRDGFFSFEEKTRSDLSRNGRVSLRVEALLMESARRLDEWSRIADRIPDAHAVPAFAETDGGEQSRLELLADEWEVLVLIDGTRDIRAIAESLSRPPFEVAKVLFGLATTGVVDIHLAEATGNA
jgi:uncharacterized protein DUF4388